MVVRVIAGRPVVMRVGVSVGFLKGVRVGVTVTVVGSQACLDTGAAVAQVVQSIADPLADDAQHRLLAQQCTVELGIGVTALAERHIFPAHARFPPETRGNGDGLRAAEQPQPFHGRQECAGVVDGDRKSVV